MDVLLKPSMLRGTVTPPPSKSQAHRLILAASLAEGVSRIGNVALSQDIEATIRCMEILGTSSEYRARKIAETAAKFSLPALTNGVRLCAECAMKPRENGAITDAEAIKEFLIRFAMESRRA